MNDKDMKFNEIAEKIREADAILIGAATACLSLKGCIFSQTIRRLKNFLAT